jgi:hypothetical protein
MRFVIPLLLSVIFVAGTAAAQPTGSSSAGNMPLSPSNCGTPDEPKACPSTVRAHHHPVTHKAPTTSKATISGMLGFSVAIRLEP